jgi:hypothetical protein
MGGLYVRFQVRDYGFCRSWVSKDREDVGKELILLLHMRRVDSWSKKANLRKHGGGYRALLY